jgi:uncharacterized membrane protein
VDRSVRRQVAVAAALGVVVGLVVGALVQVSLGLLAGFDAAALDYIGRVWWRIGRLDADATADLATREDPNRSASDVILLLAAIASLAAIAVVIVESHSSHGSIRAAEIGLGAGSIAVAWVLVHTIFTLAYARLYYSGGSANEGGVKFEAEVGAPATRDASNVRPPYSDFAYLAFTVGMTFQVSDTDLQSVAFRRLALRHSLLSYVFGAVILAAAINLISGLAG